MQQAGYHHANMLASQMRVDLNNQQAEMLALMQDIVVQDQPPAQEVIEDNAPVQQVANAAIADNTDTADNTGGATAGTTTRQPERRC